MTAAEGGGIFISYRRQETSHLAGRLYDRLVDRFGESQVFIDVDAIEPGVDFAEEIFHAVAACKVLLAIIGPVWLTATDERGDRRLDDLDDIVRLEIEAALARGVRVIPILVEGAIMPARQDLPESLAALARRNALVIRHESFRYDAGRLVDAIERVLAVSGIGAVSTAAGSPGTRAVGDTAGKLAQKGSGPVRTDVSVAALLLVDAESIANSITVGDAKASALSGIAKALAATDPDHAERIANSITSEYPKASALSGIANALAATDPDHAERIANSITSEYAKALTLSGIAKALAAIDPDRAARPLADAERIANSITDAQRKALTLSGIAKTLAVTDPDRAARPLADAERIANSITDAQRKALTLSGIAKTLAVTDPDRAARLLADAERIANSITDAQRKALTLSGIANALAATDPDRAERVASSITIEDAQASALSDIAAALAATDPDRAARLLGYAERIAILITDAHRKALTLSGIAKALAATDPDRAERIANSIISEYPKASALSGIANALAATDPDRAERIASSITIEDAKASALSGIAKTLAAIDPDRAARLLADAERIANSITDEDAKASALSGIARALAVASEVLTGRDAEGEVVQVPGQGAWQRQMLAELYPHIGHLRGILALMDLTAEHAPEPVSYADVKRRSGMSDGQQRGDHSALTRIAKEVFGHRTWPFAWRQTADGAMQYWMPTRMADWWRELRAGPSPD